jgi:hypothetical protein
MRTCLRLIGIASLLIGFQLFSSKLITSKVKLSLVNNNISFQQSFVASNTNDSGRFERINQFSKDFEPRDNGGPDHTRGSGTR